jgi:5'(3')-deoxyribonucleotidase
MIQQSEKTILIDCDGVLSNFSEMAVGIIKEQFGIDVVCDGKNWDYFDYPEILPIKGKIWDYICGTPGIIRGLKKYNYADELISRLREIGHVICVTSTPRSQYYPSERFMWLIEELGFARKDVIIGYHKHLVWGDVFIDDKPSNVVSWTRRWYGVPVLWQTPGWYIDSREEDPGNIFRTGSVDELFDYLHKMKVIA